MLASGHWRVPARRRVDCGRGVAPRRVTRRPPARPHAAAARAHVVASAGSAVCGEPVHAARPNAALITTLVRPARVRHRRCHRARRCRSAAAFPLGRSLEQVERDRGRRGAVAAVVAADRRAARPRVHGPRPGRSGCRSDAIDDAGARRGLAAGAGGAGRTRCDSLASMRQRLTPIGRDRGSRGRRAASAGPRSVRRWSCRACSPPIRSRLPIPASACGVRRSAAIALRSLRAGRGGHRHRRRGHARRRGTASCESLTAGWQAATAAGDRRDGRGHGRQNDRRSRSATIDEPGYTTWIASAIPCRPIAAADEAAVAVMTDILNIRLDDRDSRDPRPGERDPTADAGDHSPRRPAARAIGRTSGIDRADHSPTRCRSWRAFASLTARRPPTSSSR